jgi:hypothetical protein
MPSEAQDTKAMLANAISVQLGADAPGSAEQIASVAVVIWTATERALSPIIGLRGMSALYRRSLQLTSAAFPCLASIRDDLSQVSDFAMLRAALAHQDREVAAAANLALLGTFYDLVTSLIGRSLTDRLLRSAWENLSSGDAAQDTST